MLVNKDSEPYDVAMWDEEYNLVLTYLAFLNAANAVVVSNKYSITF